MSFPVKYDGCGSCGKKLDYMHMTWCDACAEHVHPNCCHWQYLDRDPHISRSIRICEACAREQWEGVDAGPRA